MLLLTGESILCCFCESAAIYQWHRRRQQRRIEDDELVVGMGLEESFGDTNPQVSHPKITLGMNRATFSTVITSRLLLMALVTTSLGPELPLTRAPRKRVKEKATEGKKRCEADDLATILNILPGEVADYGLASHTPKWVLKTS
nr:uncharacterized protein LOC109173786 [Ipomoea batatas]GME21576.1 uncharacterized protein LOC109173786 [Ipomoea batatas]